MSELVTAARPYAKAAFAYAVENKAQMSASLSQWAKALELLGAVIADKNMAQLLTNPSITLDTQVQLILEIVPDLMPPMKSFVRVLAENKRLLLLPQIATLFAEYHAEAEKRVEVKVQSAYPLDTAEQQKLIAALTKKLNRQVELCIETDASLLGGVTIRVGDLVIDGSVRGQLTRLTNSLANPGH